MNSIFDKRRRSLEDEFFYKHQAELIAQRKAEKEAQDKIKAMSEASGIKSKELLEKLIDLGLHSETMCALTIIPLIEVAWASGTVEDGERKVLMKAAEEHGIRKGSPGHDMLEHWLSKKPGKDLLDSWVHYVKTLVKELDKESVAKAKQGIMNHAEEIAEAAGGFLGLGKTSLEEQHVLDKLEAAFKTE
jgi:hypothetical protein